MYCRERERERERKGLRKVWGGRGNEVEEGAGASKREK